MALSRGCSNLSSNLFPQIRCQNTTLLNWILCARITHMLDYDQGLRIFYNTSLVWLPNVVIFYAGVFLTGETFTEERIFLYVPMWPVFVMFGVIISVTAIVCAVMTRKIHPAKVAFMVAVALSTLIFPIVMTLVFPYD